MGHSCRCLWSLQRENKRIIKKYDINDSYGLIFDGIYPKVELFRKQGNREYANSLYVKGKNKGNIEEYYEYVSPIHSLAQIRKWPWLYVRFEADAGLQQSPLVKKAVTIFRKNNYIAQQVYAGLNPKSRTSDHYHDYTEFSAQLWAGNGKIAISGNLEGLLDEKNKTVLLEPLINLEYKEIGE